MPEQLFGKLDPIATLFPFTRSNVNEQNILIYNTSGLYFYSVAIGFVVAIDISWKYVCLFIFSAKKFMVKYLSKKISVR